MAMILKAYLMNTNKRGSNDMKNFILSATQNMSKAVYDCNGHCASTLKPLLMSLKNCEDEIVKITIVNPFNGDQAIAPLIDEIDEIKSKINLTCKLQIVNFSFDEDKLQFIESMLNQIDDEDTIYCDLTKCTLNLALSIFTFLIYAYIFKHACIETIIYGQLGSYHDIGRVVNITNLLDINTTLLWMKGDEKDFINKIRSIIE